LTSNTPNDTRNRDVKAFFRGLCTARFSGFSGRFSRFSGRLSAFAGCALLGTALACSSQAPYVWATSLPRTAAQSPASSRVEPGDTIAVAVRAQDGMTGAHVVSLDGHVVLPLVGSVHVAGREPSAIARELEKLLSVAISSPQVSVVLMSKKKLEVSVLGEVAQPGKYGVDPRDGVAAALAMAGGLSEFADEDSIYLVREHSPRVRFRMFDLVSGEPDAPSLALRDGDLVVVE
jgi:polysaccharide export outer membrane protein